MGWAVMTYVWITYPVSEYTLVQTFQFSLMLAYLVGTSIDASHELIHRPEFFFQAVGYMNMALFQFAVYPIEHLYLHHKYVGSSKDPITSPKN